MTGRNDACPCGSGKKFKKCCAGADAGPGRTPVSREQQSALIALLTARRHAELEALAAALIARHESLGIVYKVLGVSRGLAGKDPIPALQQASALLPRDVETHKNLGNALLLAGRAEEAARAFRQALARDSRYAHAHAGLGKALRALGRPREAVACLHEALRLRHDHADTHTDLGAALLALGEPAAALASFRKAATLGPGDSVAHAGLGDALLGSGAPEEATGSYRKALALDPTNASVNVNLGIAERLAGRLEAALSSFERAVAVAPSMPEAHDGLGSVLLELGRRAEAIACYREALRLRPDYAAAHANLGVALLAVGDAEAAVSSFDEAQRLMPGRVDVDVQRATALQQLGRTSEAEAALARALEVARDSAAVHVAVANVHADAGRFAAADSSLREALRIAPDFPEALAAMAYLRPLTTADGQWREAVERAANGPLPVTTRVPLWYALGKYHDDLGDPARGFACFRTANELEKSLRRPHDRAALSRTVDAIIGTITPNWIEANAAADGNESRSLFVVGLPRSGTTLVEQILASHPRVHGAGELTYWDEEAATAWPELTDRDSARRTIRRLAAGYRSLIDRIAPSADRVVDKLPKNFLHAGLIHAALPGARIIHVERAPADTCLSIYFQHFHVAHTYANDLHDIAHFFGEYSRLMNHWRRVLPAEALLELRYEELVADPESAIRRLLAFVGLDWDPHCLAFHATDRPVLTASRWQVRQPLSRRSVGRADRYAEWLGPLSQLAPRGDG